MKLPIKAVYYLEFPASIEALKTGENAMFKTLLGIILIVVLSTACSVRSGHLRVNMPGAEVGVETGSNGTHCPPGQAKKGRC